VLLENTGLFVMLAVAFITLAFPNDVVPQTLRDEIKLGMSLPFMP